jgi:hypothetical protein
MQRYYDTLAEFERDGFTVIVDKTYEDLPVRDMFDDTCHNIKEIERKIDNGTYEWFMMRVRVLVEGLEMGSAYLGGMLYDNPKDCLTDGTAEDMIYEALTEAKRDVYRLKQKFCELSDMIDREGVTA